MEPALITSSSELFSTAEKESLYTKLIIQVKKDFQLASVDLEVEDIDNITPNTLLHSVEDAVFIIIQKDNVSYLNLLYIVDVPEKAIRQLQSDDVEHFSKDIAFLILKRCWMKVWYKAKY